MVWFQCEDCGENLKKPKLPNHFRICSAYKLSCIDCGQIFGQQSVQGHTQCITEAEKYGPKGQGGVPTGRSAKPSNDAKQKPEVDINVGLSERAPWFCRLCNTKATSQQTLLLHAEGKKHRAKARAFHAAKQQPIQEKDSIPDSNSTQKLELASNMDVQPKEDKNLPNGPDVLNSFMGNGDSQSSKKRKLEPSVKNNVAGETARGDMSGELGNGEVIQVDRTEKGETRDQVKKAKQSKMEEDREVERSSTIEDNRKKIKWKKLIKSALKSNPKGVLKMRKLRKHVTEALRESDFKLEECHIADLLEKKVSSSSRFLFDGKYVRLVTKS